MKTSQRPADRLVIALAQLDCTVGDIAGNAARIRAARATAAGQGADLVMFSELFLAGYPPEDLVLKPAFQEACRTAVEALARETEDGGPALLVGLPWVEYGDCYNACALLDAGRIEAVHAGKQLPPKASSSITVGERLRISMPGGGGYGDQHKRPAERVADDVERGLVSKQSARDHYGVALKADGSVDAAETAKLRTKVAAE